MPYYYGFDWTYIVLVLPCVILSLWASANVNSTFKRYSQQYSRRGLTGAQRRRKVAEKKATFREAAVSCHSIHRITFVASTKSCDSYSRIAFSF